MTKEQFIPAPDCPYFYECTRLDETGSCFIAYTIRRETEKALKDQNYSFDRSKHPLKRCSHPQLEIAVNELRNKLGEKVLFRADKATNSRKLG